MSFVKGKNSDLYQKEVLEGLEMALLVAQASGQFVGASGPLASVSSVAELAGLHQHHDSCFLEIIIRCEGDFVKSDE